MFGAVAEDISIVEFNHDDVNMVQSLQYQSGFLVLIDRLGNRNSKSITYYRQIIILFKSFYSI